MSAAPPPVVEAVVGTRRWEIETSPAREPSVAGIGRGPTASGVLAGAGFVLSLVALTHVALIWWPQEIGSPPWEFLAATQTVDVFPLAAAGAGLLAYAAMLEGRRGRALLLAILSAGAVVVLLGAGVFVMLSLPVAWKSMTGAARETLIETGAKALLLAALFTVYHVWLTARLIRFRRATR